MGGMGPKKHGVHPSCWTREIRGKGDRTESEVSPNPQSRGQGDQARHLFGPRGHGRLLDRRLLRPHQLAFALVQFEALVVQPEHKQRPGVALGSGAELSRAAGIGGRGRPPRGQRPASEGGAGCAFGLRFQAKRRPSIYGGNPPPVVMRPPGPEAEAVHHSIRQLFWKGAAPRVATPQHKCNAKFSHARPGSLVVLESKSIQGV